MEKSKKWVLLANMFDPTLLRNDIALDLAEQLGVPYTPRHLYVDVTMDKTYLGSYLLTQPVRVGKNHVDLNLENGDFLIECERERVEEDTTYIITELQHIRFIVKEAESDTEEILACLRKAEEALATHELDRISEVIDVDSFVNDYILNEYLLQSDVANSSSYFFWKNGKLYAGPAWDFDLSAGNYNPGIEDYYRVFYDEDGNSYRGFFVNQNYYYRMLYECPAFVELVKARFAAIQPIIRNIYAEGGAIDQTLEACGNSFLRNFEQAGWDVSSSYAQWQYPPLETYEENVEYLRQWLKNRNEWLCEAWEISNLSE